MNEDLLIKRCQEGSQKDMEELVRKYYYPLLKFFSKYELNTQLCEDLTHDTILKMIENIEKYRHINGVKFSTWLFTIAYNTLMNYFNKSSNKYEGRNLVDMEAELYSNNDTEEDALRNIDHSKMREKVGSLSIEDKTLINLRYQCDLTYKDISKITGLKEKTIKWKLHSIIERLKKLYMGKEEKNELSKV